MNESDRVDRWINDLAETLSTARILVARGRAAYDSDPAIPLAFEALSNRVGDLAKKLTAADQGRFDDPVWSLAARNRDLVVHHYGRIDLDVLWRTVAEDFPKLSVPPLPTRNLGHALVDVGDNEAVREILDADENREYRASHGSLPPESSRPA